MVRKELGRLLGGALMAALVLAAASSVQAQMTGVVKGKVTDAQGNAIEGAKITITAKGMKATREIKTDKKGGFVQVGLMPGPYTITAEKGDLKASFDMTVSIGENPDIPLKLVQAGTSRAAQA